MVANINKSCKHLWIYSIYPTTHSPLIVLTYDVWKTSYSLGVGVRSHTVCPYNTHDKSKGKSYCSIMFVSHKKKKLWVWFHTPHPIYFPWIVSLVAAVDLSGVGLGIACEVPWVGLIAWHRSGPIKVSQVRILICTLEMRQGRHREWCRLTPTPRKATVVSAVRWHSP